MIEVANKKLNSVCCIMRPIERERFKYKYVIYRWNAKLLPLSGTSEIILAAVMEARGNGNKDEHFYLSFQINEDSFGRLQGSYLVSTRGMCLVINKNDNVYYMQKNPLTLFHINGIHVGQPWDSCWPTLPFSFINKTH